MTFKQRNAYYLRISTNIILPLFLYLDERHVDWMSDVVLQHVLADLRPLIIPKLQVEKDVHFGPGAVPGNKRGTVEVHRGGSYQFAYFFRKTEPHTVLSKARYFVTAPIRTEVVPKRASSRSVDQNLQKKRLRTQSSDKHDKRKRVEYKGKDRISHDEDECSAEESGEFADDTEDIPTKPRQVRKQRRTITDVSQRDGGGDVDDMHQDVAINSPPPEMDGGTSESLDVPIIGTHGTVAWDSNDQLPDTADIELVVEEEMPKPLLKLRYQSFPISGHCLCVVVEPWSPLHIKTKVLGTSPRHGVSDPSLLPLNACGMVEQRAKTPLFFPEYERAPSEGPFARGLFHGAMSRMNDNNRSDDLMIFSQTLNAVGHMHAIAADDDDLDGAVLFGDADEMRELL